MQLHIYIKNDFLLIKKKQKQNKLKRKKISKSREFVKKEEKINKIFYKKLYSIHNLNAKTTNKQEKQTLKLYSKYSNMMLNKTYIKYIFKAKIHLVCLSNGII